VVKITAVDPFLVPPQWLFVRVRTDEGITGWGEAGIAFRARAIAATIEELSDYLVDASPLTIEHHWQVLTKVGFFRGGPVLSSAVAAIDEALWDIAGKSRGVPVHELLGGAVRDRIRAYVCIADEEMGAYSPDEIADEASSRAAEGFTAFKLSPGRPLSIDVPAQTAGLIERIHAVREAIGPERDLILDCHGRLSKTMAKRLLPRLEPYQLLFVAEPLLAEYGHLLGELAQASAVPLATGERLYSRWDFKRVLASGIAVAQPDVSQAGGISETRRIAALAEVFDVTVAPHCPLGPIALAASLQIDFATPNILIQEQGIARFGDTFLDYLVDPSVFEIRNGYFARPASPGLGIDVDEQMIERAAAIGHRARPPIWRHPDGSLAEFRSVGVRRSDAR
jgi:galactonate dehydratase